MHAVLEDNQDQLSKEANLRFKNILPCQKERFSRQREREETNMVSGKEWLPLTEEKFWQVEEPKEERNCLCHQNLDIKNND